MSKEVVPKACVRAVTVVSVVIYILHTRFSSGNLHLTSQSIYTLHELMPGMENETRTSIKPQAIADAKDT